MPERIFFEGELCTVVGKSSQPKTLGYSILESEKDGGIYVVNPDRIASGCKYALVEYGGSLHPILVAVAMSDLEVKDQLVMIEWSGQRRSISIGRFLGYEVPTSKSDPRIKKCKLMLLHGTYLN